MISRPYAKTTSQIFYMFIFNGKSNLKMVQNFWEIIGTWTWFLTGRSIFKSSLCDCVWAWAQTIWLGLTTMGSSITRAIKPKMGSEKLWQDIANHREQYSQQFFCKVCTWYCADKMIISNNSGKLPISIQVRPPARTTAPIHTTE